MANQRKKRLSPGRRPPASGVRHFCYVYDPATTRMEAFPDGTPYEGLPKPLRIKDPAGYLQPWSGYCPDCDLKDKSQCEKLPCQTSNIKVDGKYAGIEVMDNRWMKMACAEARLSVKAQGGPFGAVIVQIDDSTGKVLRYWRNHNHVTIWNDPTAHAEVTTIRAACQELGVFDLGEIKKAQSRLPQTGKTSHCEIYSSAEPCPMCFAAISWARIPALVFAATRYDAAEQGVGFSDEIIYDELAQPYAGRAMKVRQSTTPVSLDAFNLWKRTQKTPY